MSAIFSDTNTVSFILLAYNFLQLHSFLNICTSVLIGYFKLADRQTQFHFLSHKPIQQGPQNNEVTFPCKHEILPLQRDKETLYLSPKE